MTEGARLRRATTTAIVLGVTALTTLVLDVSWLGVLARGLYASALAPLGRSAVFLPAAGLFYAFYVVVIVGYAVEAAGSVAAAARRGAMLGLVVYASYELTNWAVLRDWPAVLVPIDIGWGVVLTATAAAMGKLVEKRLSRSPA